MSKFRAPSSLLRIYPYQDHDLRHLLLPSQRPERRTLLLRRPGPQRGLRQWHLRSRRSRGRQPHRPTHGGLRSWARWTQCLLKLTWHQSGEKAIKLCIYLLLELQFGVFLGVNTDINDTTVIGPNGRTCPTNHLPANPKPTPSSIYMGGAAYGDGHIYLCGGIEAGPTPITGYK